MLGTWVAPSLSSQTPSKSMRRVRRRGQADHIPTCGFSLNLLMDFPLGLEPMPQRSSVQRAFALPEFEGPLFEPVFAFVVHGQPNPKNDRTAITTTTRPTR